MNLLISHLLQADIKAVGVSKTLSTLTLTKCHPVLSGELVYNILMLLQDPQVILRCMLNMS